MLDLLSYDLADLIFRALFSLIFLGLGAEHLVDDRLIRKMMPPRLAWKRAVSILSGCILLAGGLSILVGWQVQYAAALLGAFVLAVTLTVHGPGLMTQPNGLPGEWRWLWQVYQRSNFVKNLCLLGVCFLLLRHRLGKYSLEAWLGGG